MAGRAAARRNRGTAAVRVVVTGPFAAGKSTLIRTVSEATVLATERAVRGADGAQRVATTVAMDYGRITIDDELVLHLFGTPGQDRFDFMWDILREGMLGYILLIDADRPDCLGEAVPILQAFRRMARVPFVVALNRMDTVGAVDELRVREALSLDADVPVVACDATDRESVKGVLLALLYAVLEPADSAAAHA